MATFEFFLNTSLWVVDLLVTVAFPCADVSSFGFRRVVRKDYFFEFAFIFEAAENALASKKSRLGFHLEFAS